MKPLIITVSKDDAFFDVGKESKVYIFENVKEYHDEICDMIKENKITYQDLKRIIESWGGNIELLTINDLIKNYKKNKAQGLHI